jgi:hypothetical protein
MGFDELKRLRVLDAVMMEVLRLYGYVLLLRQVCSLPWLLFSFFNLPSVPNESHSCVRR